MNSDCRKGLNSSHFASVDEAGVARGRLDIRKAAHKKPLTGTSQSAAFNYAYKDALSLSAQDTPEVDGEHVQFQDSLLENLVGSWKVTGMIAGQRIEHDCNAGWVLNHQFLNVHFLDVTQRRVMRAGERQDPRYEADVFIGYDNMSERYVAHWLDTFGGRFSEVLGYGTRMNRGHSIRFVFEGGSGPLHNTVTWNRNDGTWTMVITQKDSKAKWQTFASELFKKS